MAFFKPYRYFTASSIISGLSFYNYSTKLTFENVNNITDVKTRVNKVYQFKKDFMLYGTLLSMSVGYVLLPITIVNLCTKYFTCDEKKHRCLIITTTNDDQYVISNK